MSINPENAPMDDLGDFVKHIPVALYRTTHDGKLIAGNPALATLLGYESVAAMEKGLESADSVYVDPARRIQWLEMIENSGVVHEFDVELRRTDGTTLWVQDTARVIRDDKGRVLYFDGAIIDVTEKVAARNAKDEFVATVSHELRNPIAVMLGLGEELATNYDTFSDDERQEMARLIARQAEDASWLIEDLLVAYSADSRGVSIAPQVFDLVKEAERVLEVVDYPVTVEVRSEPNVFADPRRARQIVRNLVSNALRYGGETIVVRVVASGDRRELMVCDNGHPLPSEDVERIFRPFERG
ncbi:MAG: PAS domain-containing sensor histidine kinase, partial [Actinobacteria bacterium]|nr:PAS domain-containing sensor histidine kinase [Actinomycetota bacterium]